MVLGANPASFTPQSGANGGYVVRYNLNVPYLTGPASAVGAQITNYASVGGRAGVRVREVEEGEGRDFSLWE